MKAFGLLVAHVVIGSGLYAQVISSTSVNASNAASLYASIPNSATGTTLNMLTKIVTGQAQITATTDTFGIFGITIANAGTTGNALVQSEGIASCVFDGATTAGHWVVQSTTVNGNCHDTGSTNPPTVGDIMGQVLTTNGIGGTYQVFLLPFQGTPRTGTSGGILAYTGTSSIGSSVALTANVLVKGGGAGVAPGLSSITDNGTTISTTEPFSLGDGSSTTQSIFFTSQGQGSGKAGFWRDSTAAVGITAMHMSDGSCTVPGYAWANTGSLGFDRNSATEIAVCANGQIGALGTTLKWGSGSPFQVTSTGAISTTATANQLLLGNTTINAPATTAVTVNQPILLSNTGAYTAIASTNAETFFGIAGDGKIPAGAINAAGRRIEMEFAGIYGTNGVTDTINLKFKLCTVSGCGSGTVVQVATTGVVTPGAAVTNQGWSARVVCNVYTAGASGTIDCQGLPGAVYFTALTTVILDDIVNTATSTVDTTVNEFVSASATWNNNSGNNTITLRNFAAKVL